MYSKIKKKSNISKKCDQIERSESRKSLMIRSGSKGDLTRVLRVFSVLALSFSGTALAGEYVLEIGQGVPVCEGYRKLLQATSPYKMNYCTRRIDQPTMGFSKPDFKPFYPKTDEMMLKIYRFLWERDANPGWFYPTEVRSEWRGTQEQMDIARERYLNDRNRRRGIGHRIAQVDIDNDGYADNVYLDRACNAYGSILMVFNKDNTAIDNEKTEMVMRHPSRKEAEWPVYRSVKKGEAAPYYVELGYMPAPDAIHQIFYDVFVYSGQTYFDQIWSDKLVLNGKTEIEEGNLRVFTIQGKVPKEVCTIRYGIQESTKNTKK